MGIWRYCRPSGNYCSRRRGEHPGTVFDSAFIEKNTVGYEGLKTHLAEQSLEALADAAGIPVGTAAGSGGIDKGRKKIIVCWAMGITQQKNGVDTIKEIVNLVLLKGSLGKPGAGLCPVRGHSNVQGNRTMMIWEQPPAWFLDKLKEVFGFEPPREHGVDVVNCIKAMHEGKIKVCFCDGWQLPVGYAGYGIYGGRHAEIDA